MKSNTYELMRIEREKSIIEVAKDIFLSRGIVNVRMKDIASEANISRQTLYSYYKDIGEIIIAVEEEILNNMQVKSLGEESNNTPLEYIKEYVSSTLEIIDNYPKEMIFMLQVDLYLKMYSQDKELVENLEKIFINSESRENVINQIKKGQNDKSIRDDKSSSEIYSTIINILMGLIQRILLIDNRVDITNGTTTQILRENIIDMVMKYIKV
ncbi:MAG: TetR/AcrR family transcriptional regulator [Peptostreptococcaceae bacterium]